MTKLFAAALAVAFLAACTTAQLQTAQTDVNTASAAIVNLCASAAAAKAKAQATLKGGALNTVNSVAAYSDAACATADTVAAIAKDPSTQAWLTGIVGSINSVQAAASATVAPVAAPAPAPAS